MVRHGILIPALRWFESSMSNSVSALADYYKSWYRQRKEFRFVNLYHIGLVAIEMRLIVVIAHTAGCVAIVLFSEVIAHSRKLCYAFYCVVECLLIRLNHRVHWWGWECTVCLIIKSYDFIIIATYSVRWNQSDQLRTVWWPREMLIIIRNFQ